MSNLSYIRKLNKFARENLRKAQCGMKTWYDKIARECSFKPGDERVIALLPIHGNALQARFCGPSTIIERVNDPD